MKFLHIGGDSRTGGSLLARLFDGCKDILSFPFEEEYFKNRNGALIDFEKYHNSLLIDDLRAAEVVAKIIKFGEGTLTGKQHYSTTLDNFNVDRFMNGLSDAMRNTNNIHEAVHKAYFEELHSEDSFVFSDSKLIVNHCSRTFIAELDEFYDKFEDGYFIQTVRSPLDTIASMKSYSFARTDTPTPVPPRFIDMAIQRWLISFFTGLQNRNKYSKYKILFYERLVESPDAIKEVCKFIAIPFDEEMLIPSYRGTPWHGNSSFGKRASELIRVNKDKYKQVLTEMEISKIQGTLSTLWADAAGLTTDLETQCVEKLNSINSRIDPTNTKELREHYNTLFEEMREIQKGG